MRVAFNLVAVHVRARIAFVRIADDVFLVCVDLLHHLPLDGGRETGTAAPAQLGFLDFLENAVRRHVCQRFEKRAVPADGDVFLDILRIDESRFAEHDLFLPLEERDLIP